MIGSFPHFHDGLDLIAAAQIVDLAQLLVKSNSSQLQLLKSTAPDSVYDAVLDARKISRTTQVRL